MQFPRRRLEENRNVGDAGLHQTEGRVLTARASDPHAGVVDQRGVAARPAIDSRSYGEVARQERIPEPVGPARAPVIGRVGAGEDVAVEGGDAGPREAHDLAARGVPRPDACGADRQVELHLGGGRPVATDDRAIQLTGRLEDETDPRVGAGPRVVQADASDCRTGRRRLRVQQVAGAGLADADLAGRVDPKVFGRVVVDDEGRGGRKRPA